VSSATIPAFKKSKNAKIFKKFKKRKTTTIENNYHAEKNNYHVFQL